MILFQDTNITIFQSSLFQTNSIVVHTEDLVMVVDPGWLPAEIKQIQKYVNDIRNGRPLYVFYTHSDYDHIIGHGAFPEAKIISSDSFARKKDKEKVIEQILRFDDSYYIERDYQISFPEPDIIIKEDGQSLTAGHTSLFFYLTPGHTECSAACLVEPGGILIAGDYLAEVEFPYIYHSSYQYEQTLSKFKKALLNPYEIHMLIPGHGPAADSKLEIEARRSASLRYIEQLRVLVQENKIDQSYNLISGYPFPGIMNKFHEGNIQLIKEELTR